MISETFVVNYPTVGSLFFKENYERYSGNNVNLIFNYKEITKDKNIVVILKDPKQLITARAAISKNKHDIDIVSAIKKSIEQYILVFQTAMNNSNTVYIDYDDMMDNFVEMAGKVAQTFSHDMLPGFKLISEFDILQKHNSDPFGETMDGYEEVANIVAMIDLSRCYQIYYDLLKKAIR